MKIIMSHRYLDFDALASMVAAQKIYPDAQLVIDGKHGIYVQEFLSLAKEHLPFFKLKDINVDEIEKIILVDTNDLSRSVGNKELLQRLYKVPLEIIDHHPYHGSRQDHITIHQVGACTTILVERILSKGLRLNSFDATILALGIYDDTGSLLFESTTSRDLSAAAYLLEQGAQLGVVAEYLHKPLNMEQMDLFQQLLDQGSTEKYREMPIYISHAETEEYVDGLALLIHRLGEIENADVWFIVVRMENRVYVVGRSRGSGLPVNKIVEAFGGAGHDHAASAVVKDKPLQDVIHTLIEEIQKRVEQPNLIRDIMSYPVKTAQPNTTVEDAGKMLLRYGHTGLPVVEDDSLLGVISRRDVDKAIKHGLLHAPVKGFMTKDVVTVHPDLSWEEVQKLMVEHDVGRIPVVENEKLIGIVSRSDILHLVYGRMVPTTSDLVRERSIARREDTLQLIRQLPTDTRILLETIREVATILDYRAYLVGGFVRDLLLGIATIDLDVVVEGDGIKFADLLSQKMKTLKLIPHFPFGTARLLMDDGTHLDIAGSRREDYDYPGALPTVEESTLKDDLFRRDFTINAMALCLNDKGYGDIVDYYGGYRDLHQGEIRFLHNLSFIDDPTRIMRAIRFAGRYDFKLAKITRDAIGIALETKVFTKISAERFTEELLLIFNEKKYQTMGRSLMAHGVLKAWIGLEYPWNFSESEEAAQDWAIDKRWLMCLKDIDVDGVNQILSRLKLNKQMSNITAAYIHLREELKRYLHDLIRVDELILGAPNLLMGVLAEHAELVETMKVYTQRISAMKMNVNGAKLIQMGMKEGPHIGRTIKEIRNCWLSGIIKTPEEEEEYLQRLLCQLK